MEAVNIKFVLCHHKVLCLYQPGATQITYIVEIDFTPCSLNQLHKFAFVTNGTIFLFVLLNASPSMGAADDM